MWTLLSIAGSVLLAAPAVADAARQGPDLTLRTPRVSATSVAADGSLRVSVTVRNIGDSLARPSVLRVYASRNASFQRTDTRMGSVRVSRIRPGAKRIAKLDISAARVGAGRWYLVACADARHSVRESDEDNNCRTGTRIRVAPAFTMGDPTVTATGTTVSASFTTAGGLEPVVTTCRLDLGATSTCTSPAAFNDVSLGEHTITVIATDALGSIVSASGSATVTDTDPPTGMSVSVTGGATPNDTASVTFSTGVDTLAGIDSWQLQRATAALSAGSCAAYGAYADIGGANPTSPAVLNLVDQECNRFRLVVTDAANNSANSGASSDVISDQQAPTGGSISWVTTWTLGVNDQSSIPVTIETGTDATLTSWAIDRQSWESWANCDTPSGSFTADVATDPAEPTYSDSTGLAWTTCYRYRLRVADAAGNETAYDGPASGYIHDVDADVDGYRRGLEMYTNIGMCSNGFYDTVFGVTPASFPPADPPGGTDDNCDGAP